MKPRRIEVLGVPVDCVNMEGALSYVDELIDSGGSATVIAVNPEKVMKACKDSWLLEQMRNAALLLPDGIGVVWAARILYGIRIERVAGADLMQALSRRAAERGYGVFLYGASATVNADARKALERTYPGIRIAGNRDGFLPESEMPSLVGEINASGARLLFVALGSPQQERWMASHLPQLRGIVCQGVGGTLDVLTGKVRRAPPSWQRLHLEWAYRLLRQPSRLLRQTALPTFAFRVLSERIRRAQEYR